MTGRHKTDAASGSSSRTGTIDGLSRDVRHLVNTALDVREDAEAGLRTAVRTAMSKGASVDELAELTGLRRNAIAKWQRV